MDKIEAYIKEVLGINILLEELDSNDIQRVPHYIRGIFQLYHATLYKEHFVIAEFKPDSNLNTMQVQKQLQLIEDVLKMKTVLLTYDLAAINRKRLIEKGINFIVPHKQFYLPDLFINLKEDFAPLRKQGKKLLPSAQFILIYKILKHNEKIEQYTLKQLAVKLNYTPMTITDAVNNLTYLQLCTTEGSKEKYIRFHTPIRELWQKSLPLMVNPVLKKVYVDEKPKNVSMLKSNLSALPEYSEIAESNQQYFAIEKNMFYAVQKDGQLVNPNEQEGKYCLEVWKYDPNKLAQDITKEANVDPISLYLSLKDNHDERIQMALEKITEKYIW